MKTKEDVVGATIYYVYEDRDFELEEIWAKNEDIIRRHAKETASDQGAIECFYDLIDEDDI